MKTYGGVKVQLQVSGQLHTPGQLLIKHTYHMQRNQSQNKFEIRSLLAHFEIKCMDSD
jgi:hypothetical protein